MIRKILCQKSCARLLVRLGAKMAQVRSHRSCTNNFGGIFNARLCGKSAKVCGDGEMGNRTSRPVCPGRRRLCYDCAVCKKRGETGKANSVRTCRIETHTYRVTPAKWRECCLSGAINPILRRPVSRGRGAVRRQQWRSLLKHE